jgi:hypothetical protein
MGTQLEPGQFALDREILDPIAEEIRGWIKEKHDSEEVTYEVHPMARWRNFSPLCIRRE